MIHVFLRHCYISPNQKLANRQRPEWFNKVGVWDSFMRYTNRDKCRVTCFYDNAYGDSTDEYYHQHEPDELIVSSHGTEALSFLAMLRNITNRSWNPDDIIYLVEDDYLHRPDWEIILAEGITKADYVTLYDHADKYQYYPGLKSEIYLTPGCHWRTTPSTCNTYACRWALLSADIHTHEFYSRTAVDGITRDHDKFVALTNKGRSLISSIPGYATHVDGFMSPTFDWATLI